MKTKTTTAATSDVHVDDVNGGDTDSTDGGPAAETVAQDTTSLLLYQTPRRGQSKTAWLPLRRPPDDAPPEMWEAYRNERRRRKIVKRERRGRIARRESPHDVHACAYCGAAPARELDIDVAEVARRSMFSRSHVYRVLDPSVKSRRGLKTLASLRRIAHDGLGISLDEFARLVLPD